MANERTTRYRVEIDLAAARKEAAEFARVFQTEVNRAMQQATAAAGGAAGGAGGGGGIMGAMGMGKMLGGALGGLGGYLTIQGIKNMAIGAAELSVAVNRSTNAFVALSGSAEEAEKRLKAIQQASGSTMDNMQAMNLANRLVSLGMAKSAEEMERAVTVGRKIGVVMGTDVTYALENLSLAAANLSFMRLDQMGISATQVRARMKELQAANADLGKEQAFLSAALEIAESTFKDVDVSAAETISGMEKLSTAWKNLTQTIAASGLGQAINKQIGDFADAVNVASGHGDAGKLARGRMEGILSSRQSRYANSQGGNFFAGWMGGADAEAIENMQKAADAFDRLRSLMDAGVPGLENYDAALTHIIEAMNSAGGQAAPQLQAELSGLLKIVASLEGDTTAYAKAVEQVGQEFLEADPNAQLLAAALTNLEIMYATGAIGAAEYATQVNALTGAIVVLKANADTLAAMGPITQEAAAARMGDIPGFAPVARPSISEADWNTAVGGWTQRTPAENADARNRVDAQWEAKEKERIGREGDTRREFNDWNRQWNETQQREAEAAAREWESAAEKTQREFESAAREMVNEFKSALSDIPGLFGTSSVTPEDMRAAEAGAYQEKADEYLRQLADEVYNKKDHAGVDIYDAAARGGINAALPQEAIYEQFASMWGDSSLFAGGKNLDLINQGAVQQALARKEASKSGREAIFNLFGVPSDDNLEAMTAAGIMPTAGAPGDPAAAAAAAAGEGTQDDPVILQKLQEQMTNGAAVEALRGTGDSVAGFIYDGFASGVGARDWRSPLVDAITNQVTAQALANINDALNN